MTPRSLILSALALVAVSGAVEEEPLTADRLSLSLTRGGGQALSIDLGEEFAGHRYLVSGSASGHFPGVLRDNVRVPLNYDSYTESALTRINNSNFESFSGMLDEEGKAVAKLTQPPAKVGTLAGKVFHHAVVVMEAETGTVVKATNPVEVLLLP